MLFMHLLKWQYQPEKRETEHSWKRTIKEQRKQIKRVLRKNPGLNEILPEAYSDAIEDAVDETELELLPLFPQNASGVMIRLWIPSSGHQCDTSY